MTIRISCCRYMEARLAFMAHRVFDDCLSHPICKIRMLRRFAPTTKMLMTTHLYIYIINKYVSLYIHRCKNSLNHWCEGPEVWQNTYLFIAPHCESCFGSFGDWSGTNHVINDARRVALFASHWICLFVAFLADASSPSKPEVLAHLNRMTWIQFSLVYLSCSEIWVHHLLVFVMTLATVNDPFFLFFQAKFLEMAVAK